MAIKPHLFLFASFLLLSTSISSHELEAALVATTPAPQVKPPPPSLPSPPVAKPPTVAPPVSKPPTVAPPVAKPPTVAPPVAKPPTVAAPPTPPRNTKECYPPCLVRCKNHSRQNVCMRACVTCCDRCKCVPPGQSGNKEVCGTCYTNMKTHGGRPKCP